MHPHHRQILELMAPLRQSVCGVRPTQPEWESAQHLVEAIDKLAGEFTGDREYFFARPHCLVPPNLASGPVVKPDRPLG